MVHGKTCVLAINGNPDLYRELARQPGIDLHVLAEPAVARILEDEGIVDHCLPYCQGSKFSLASIRQVRAAVKTVRPDLVHAFSSRSMAHAVLGTSWMRRPPRLLGYRGVIHEISRLDLGHRITHFHRRMETTVCTSHAVRQALLDSGVPADRCTMIYNPLRVDSPPEHARAQLEPWGIPSDAFVVGTVATIRPVKRTDLMLKAALACQDLLDVKWVLIGPVHDPNVAALAEDPRLDGRVFMLGHQPNAVQLIGGADLFLMTSQMEGLCRSLLEAMSQRVCPIVTAVGGMREVVRHGIDGLTIPPDDLDALIDAIRQLHADRPRVRQYADSACQRVRDKFSPEQSGKQFADLYQRIAR